MNTTRLRARDIEAHALATLAASPDSPRPYFAVSADDRVANRGLAGARSNGPGRMVLILSILGFAAVFAFLGLLAVNL